MNFTFVVLLLTFWGFGSPHEPLRDEEYVQAISSQEEPFRLILTGDSIPPECKGDPFFMQLTGNDVPPECVRLTWRLYEAANGAKGTITHGAYRSPDHATARLGSWMKSAKSIIHDQERKDTGGNVVGHRIVASFRGENERQDYFQIGWTNGSECYLISSPSLSTALSLEDWIGTVAVPSLPSRQPK